MGIGQHWPELLIVLFLGMMFFGAKRLPEMGASVGKTIKEFQRSMREVSEPEPRAAVPPAASPAQQLPTTTASTASDATAQATPASVETTQQ